MKTASHIRLPALALAALLAFLAGLLPPAPARALESVLDDLAVVSNPSERDINEAVDALLKKGPVVIPYLRAALLHTAITLPDLRRPRRVVEAFGRPQNEIIARLSDNMPHEAMTRLTAVLDRDVDENAIFAAYPAAGQIPPNAADAAAAATVIRGLGDATILQPVLDAVNLALATPGLWSAAELEIYEFDGLARRLLDRALLDDDPQSLTSAEWAFLNRRALERMLAPGVWPLIDQPTDVVRHSLTAKKAAIRALARFDTPVTRAILASHRPANEAENTEIALVLAQSGKQPDFERLVRILVESIGPSANSADSVLDGLLRNNNPAAAAAVEVVLRHYLETNFLLPVDNSWFRALRLTQRLPERDFTIEALARSFTRRSPAFRISAASFIRANVSYLENVELRRLFMDNGFDNLTHDDLLAFLRNLAAATFPEAAVVAGYFLETDNIDIQNQTCDTLAAITGQPFGRNPGAWRNFLRDQE